MTVGNRASRGGAAVDKVEKRLLYFGAFSLNTSVGTGELKVSVLSTKEESDGVSL